MATKKRRRKQLYITANTLNNVHHALDARVVELETEMANLRTQLSGLEDAVKTLSEENDKLHRTTGGFWTTETGITLQVRQMSDNHIESALRLLRARGFSEDTDGVKNLLAEQNRRKVDRDYSAASDKVKEWRSLYPTTIPTIATSATDPNVESLKAQLARIREAVIVFFGATPLDTLDLVRQLVTNRMKEDQHKHHRHLMETIKNLLDREAPAVL